MQEIVFRGRLDTYTGYGQQFCPLIQFFIRAGFDVKIKATDVDESHAAMVPTMLKERVVTTDPGNDWELAMLPLQVIPDPAGKKVIYFTMYETTQISPRVVAGLNKCAAVIVPNRWNKETFERCGVKVPVFLVPLGIDKQAFRYRPPPPRNVCVFGAAGKMSHGIIRKGVKAVIDAFMREFKPHENVEMRVKEFSDTPVDIPKHPKLKITKEYLNQERVGDWIGELTCMVSAATAEGWGLWQHQALAVGRPVIGCHYGGCAEFLTPGNSYALRYTEQFAAAQSEYGGNWAVPDTDHLQELMRHVYDSNSEWKPKRYEAECKGLQGSIDTAHLTHERMALGVLDVMDKVGMLATVRPRPVVCRHSGDWGDIIFALPTIRALAKGSAGAVLHITEREDTRQRMTPERADKLSGLLKLCPYIKDVRFGPPKQLHYDLDEFRTSGVLNVSDGTFYEAFAALYGLGPEVFEPQWITVDCPTPVDGKPVVICRTQRYHSRDFPWKEVANKYRHKAVFLGFEEEHSLFRKHAAWPEIPRAETRNFLELARIIAGSALFIGNQGAAHAVAEGLKKPIILELPAHGNKVLFKRPSVQNVIKQDVSLPDL